MFLRSTICHIQEGLGLLLTKGLDFQLFWDRTKEPVWRKFLFSCPPPPLACLYLCTYHRISGPAVNMYIQDSFAAETTLPYCRNPIYYIIVQLCACYEMTYSFEARKLLSIYVYGFRLPLFTTREGILGLRGVWGVEEMFLSQTDVQQVAKTLLVLYLPICKTGQFSIPQVKISIYTQQNYSKWRTNSHSSKNLKYQKTTMTFVFLCPVITVWSSNGNFVLAVDISLAFHIWSHIFTLSQYLKDLSIYAADINRYKNMCCPVSVNYHDCNPQRKHFLPRFAFIGSCYLEHLIKL